MWVGAERSYGIEAKGGAVPDKPLDDPLEAVSRALPTESMESCLAIHKGPKARQLIRLILVTIRVVQYIAQLSLSAILIDANIKANILKLSLKTGVKSDINLPLT